MSAAFDQDNVPGTVIDVANLKAPCLVVEIDVARGIPQALASSEAEPARCAWILVRMHTKPLGIVMMTVPQDGLKRGQLVAGLTEALGAELRRGAEEVGATWPPKDAGKPLDGTRESPFLSARQQVIARAPAVTVVVCTRARPASLARCLKSLAAQEYPTFSILVVDNAPLTDESRQVAMRFASPHIALKYVVEPKVGLAWARNHAIQVASDELIAWIDDDEIADRFWLVELVKGFYEYPGAGAVSGIMLPAELRTPAQVRFEQYGGFHKHRGFAPAAFSTRTTSIQSPLFPLPPFGAGGNMAFRRDALTDIDGFDAALGAGTASLAAEDTRALTELLLSGRTVVYQPSAVTHHFHRDRHADLRRQMLGYGAGLTAFYTSLLLSQPSHAAGLIRLGPAFLQEAIGPASLRSGELPRDFPEDLRWANRRGLVEGPMRYLLAKVTARRRDRRRLVADGAAIAGRT
ncbi:MAG: glycosyltransferase family 2 protein [Candidatus Dormiibacterota bacterium]